MTRHLAALLLVACGTGAESASVDALLRERCAPYPDLNCYVTDRKPCGPERGWAYVTDNGTLCINEDLCKSDLTMCGFVVNHEICHYLITGDEKHTETCCCAAELSSAAENDAAERYFCDGRSGPRCEAVRECR